MLKIQLITKQHGCFQIILIGDTITKCISNSILKLQCDLNHNILPGTKAFDCLKNLLPQN